MNDASHTVAEDDGGVEMEGVVVEVAGNLWKLFWGVGVGVRAVSGPVSVAVLGRLASGNFRVVWHIG